MTPSELQVRTAAFAVNASAVARPLLTRVGARDPAAQLLRASSSVAANYRAARRARSHAEFIAKIGVVLEETDESSFWLEHLRDCGLVEAALVADLVKEAGELVAIFVSSNKTARDRERNRHPSGPPRGRGTRRTR